MKRAILLFWFFSFKYPVIWSPGILAVTVVGPFENEVSCQIELDNAKSMLAGFPGITFAQCSQKVEV